MLLRDTGRDRHSCTVFSDFDPSGEPCAADITQYNLPPDLAKPTDSRRKAFVHKYGDVSVELDAIPVDSGYWNNECEREAPRENFLAWFDRPQAFNASRLPTG